MGNVLRHKRGTSNPDANDFSVTSELLINTNAGSVWTKKDDNSVVQVGTTYTGGTNLTLSGTTFNVDDVFLKNNADDTTSGSITAGGKLKSTMTGGFTIGNVAGEDRIQNASNSFSFLTDGNAYANMAFATVTNGTWNGSVIASAYLDADTAHLSGTQTFSGAKTFQVVLHLVDTQLMILTLAQNLLMLMTT